MIKIKNSLISILFLSFITLPAATVKNISIVHTALQKPLPAIVVLPDSYDSTRNKFPVIYLLHGYSGDYSIFSKIVNLEHYSDSFAIIIVCPDGQYNSWYVDSPLQSKSKFETYIIHDVIGFTDLHYRTIASGGGRAIIGSSMGGHGALTLLARHPEMFASAGSISGILDLTAFPGNWDIKDVLGEYESHKDIWKKHSFMYLMKNLVNRKLGIIIDCGTSDFALEVNRAAHAKLDSLKILHDYHERPGDHSHRYVQKVLEDHIAYCVRYLKKWSVY